MTRLRKACAATLLLLLAPVTASASPLTPMQCRDWFAQAQKALDDAGIHDDGGTSIRYFPWLRTDRWLAHLRDEAIKHGGQQWMDLMAQKGLAAWTAELRRLPVSADLQPVSREGRIARMQQCSDTLESITPPRGVPPVDIPDDYADWMRVVGLYPVTRWFIMASVHNYREDMRQRFLDHPPRSVALSYTPPSFAGTVPVPEAFAHNDLSMPTPGEGGAEALFAHYAPVFTLLDDSADNLPGTITLPDGKPRVQTDRATVYHWLSWTEFEGHKLLQLNYQVWFKKRPANVFLDLYAGKLDGLIWRVTLNPDGSVLTYDSIHPCGCYHKVYPVEKDLRLRDDLGADRPVLYPHRAPDASRGRVEVVLEPGTHYVIGVYPASDKSTTTRQYRFASENVLRSLSDGHGGYASLFDANGLVPESKRRERFFLWPTGVPSAGTMRQRGHHDIAFIGKRHFDDADLMQKLFRERTPADEKPRVIRYPM